MACPPRSSSLFGVLYARLSLHVRSSVAMREAVFPRYARSVRRLCRQMDVGWVMFGSFVNSKPFEQVFAANWFAKTWIR